VYAARDNSFRNRKSDRERLQIARRTHHHGVRNAVEYERYRPLLTDVIRHGLHRVAAMPAHLPLDDARLVGRFQFVHT
jgi:hypothetical protein